MFMYIFNPYCNGRWSRTIHSVCALTLMRVLILIVVDDGLVPKYRLFNMSVLQAS